MQHACLQTYEAVSLFDDMATNLSVQYNSFVEAEANGGAWLEASCPSCETGDGYGYTWFLGGEEVGSDAPLAVRVEQVGTYSLELETYGWSCSASASFEMTVGKYLEDQNSELEWLGMHGGQLGVRFPEVWTGVEIDCYDALGRLVCTQKLGNVVGENFIALTGFERVVDHRIARFGRQMGALDRNSVDVYKFVGGPVVMLVQ